MTTYPEHEKMAALRPKIDVVTDFLEWCDRQAYVICEPEDRGGNSTWRIGRQPGIRELLAAYFEINEQKIDDEKAAMLAEIRSGHTT